MDMDKDMQDSGQFSFILCHFVHTLTTWLNSNIASACVNCLPSPYDIDLFR